MMIRNILISVLLVIVLNSCGGKLPGSDAKKYPPNPKERVKNNLEQGKGFRLDTAIKGGRGGDFEFASSNELWRASLDVIDFMPLTSANYSGGIIITDWYSDGSNPNESIKISIRFLTNEIRSDSLQIKIFKRECFDGLKNCITNEIDGVIIPELKRKILQTATLYKNEKKEEKK